jgi:hypothetical protein
LWHGKFPNKKLFEQFEVILLSRMKEKYKNVPSKILKFKVYQHTAWLVRLAVQADSRNHIDVKASKDLMIEFINQ